jgi:hypothetical protein
MIPVMLRSWYPSIIAKMNLIQEKESKNLFHLPFNFSQDGKTVDYQRLKTEAKLVETIMQQHE